MTEGAYDRLPKAIQKSKNSKIVGRPEETYTKYMTTVRDYTARSDLAIGRIRAALEEIGRTENTVIIFSSDNGSMWGAHGISGKWNMYEESIRVPMMICDPRLPKATRGTQRDQLALNIDLTATIMDIAGVPAPHMQGVSLLPVLKDPDAKTRDDWYYHHDVHTRSKGAPLPKCEGVRTEQFKYIHYKDTDPIQEELFISAKRSPGNEKPLSQARICRSAGATPGTQRRAASRTRRGNEWQGIRASDQGVTGRGGRCLRIARGRGSGGDLSADGAVEHERARQAPGLPRDTSPDSQHEHGG